MPSLPLTPARRLSGLLATAGLLAALAPGSALAAARTVQTAQAGNVSASFSYRGTVPRYTAERLTISRGGTVVYDHAVTAPQCGGVCWPAATGAHQSSVHVVNLSPSDTHDVVLDLYTGGAHCCSLEQVFRYDAAHRTYVESQHNFGDPGDRLVDLGHTGRDEFLTADDRFAYAFTDFAASGLPVQILSFSQGHFHNVTRHYPKLIARDAAAWMKSFRQQASSHYADTVGVVAAWAADVDLLGHSQQVNTFLARQAAAGHLNSALLGARGSNARFVTALKRLLHQLHY
jgi:hypothetical protein